VRVSQEAPGIDLAINLRPRRVSVHVGINVRSKATSTLEANAQWERVGIFIASARTLI